MLPLLIFACENESKLEIKDLAANEDVANFMENYKGRGVLTDSLAIPTAPKGFHYSGRLVVGIGAFRT